MSQESWLQFSRSKKSGGTVFFKTDSLPLKPYHSLLSIWEQCCCQPMIRPDSVHTARKKCLGSPNLETICCLWHLTSVSQLVIGLQISRQEVGHEVCISSVISSIHVMLGLQHMSPKDVDSRLQREEPRLKARTLWHQVGLTIFSDVILNKSLSISVPWFLHL